MAPIEVIRFVVHASLPSLLQNGTWDDVIPRPDAAELHAAAPQPREVRWYDAGHNLMPQAEVDRQRWRLETIGLDAPVGG